MKPKYKVRLDYFKPSGKWYMSGEFETESVFTYEAVREVKQMDSHPDLRGRWTGPILVTLIDSPYAVPHLILHMSGT